MKLRPSLIALYLAVTIVSQSCHKAATDVPPPSGKRTVSLVLGGDLALTESPLPGARMMNNLLWGRTLRDSTLYAVDVRTADRRPYAAGVFNDPGNIRMELPEDTSFIVTAAAFKRGSGFGMWYSLGGDNKQYFDRPLYRPLENRMVYNVTDSGFLSSFTFARIFATDTVSSAFRSSFFPEMDAFAGQGAVSADSAQVITIPMQRTAFGIRFAATNFTGGKLIVAYQSSLRTQSFTPADIGNSLRIYTADEFRRSNTLTTWERIIFVLKWEKPDGTLVTLGQKELQPPKRNHMVTVHVALPTETGTVNSGVSITLTETAWTSTNTINL